MGTALLHPAPETDMDMELAEASSRTKILLTAETLMAKKGIDGVGLREIVQMAGLKNVGSIRHYFGTKDELIREIAKQGFVTGDRWRQDRLSALEMSGAEITLRAVLDVLGTPPPPEYLPYQQILFNEQLQISRPELYWALLAEHGTVGLQRGMAHLFRILKHLPTEILLDRVDLCFKLIFAYRAHRSREEAAVAREGRWREPSFNEVVLDSLEAILTMPFVDTGEPRSEAAEANFQALFAEIIPPPAARLTRRLVDQPRKLSRSPGRNANLP